MFKWSISKNGRRWVLAAASTVLMGVMAFIVISLYAGDPARNDSLVPREIARHADATDARRSTRRSVVEQPQTEPFVHNETEPTASLQIRGIVVDPGMNPIENAQLSISVGGHSHWAASDENGAFRVTLQETFPGTVTISASCRGYDDVSSEFAESNDSIRVVMQPSGTAMWIRIRAVTADGAPVAKFATVIARSAGGSPKRRDKKMAYDRDPVYRRHDTTSGSVLLVTQYDIVDVAVIADRMTTGGISNVDVSACNFLSPKEVTITLSAGATIFGVVEFRGAGSVPKEIRVAAVPGELHASHLVDFGNRDQLRSMYLEQNLASRSSSAIEIADGGASPFELGGLSSGDYDVFVVDEYGRQRSSPSSVHVNSGDRIGAIRIVVDRGATVEINVTMNGSPVACRVVLSEWKARETPQSFDGELSKYSSSARFEGSTPDGRATIAGVPAGMYSIDVALERSAKRNPIWSKFRPIAEHLESLLGLITRTNDQELHRVAESREVWNIELGSVVSDFDRWIGANGVDYLVAKEKDHKQAITAALKMVSNRTENNGDVESILSGSGVTIDELPKFRILRTMQVIQERVAFLRSREATLDRWTWNGVGPLADAIQSMQLSKMMRFILMPGESP